MILHRYFANRFLVIFLSVTAIFTLFIGLIAYVEQLRQVGIAQMPRRWQF